jgi:hypothetical protein
MKRFGFILVLLLVTVSLLLVGCGGGDEEESTPTATPTPGETATPTPVVTATPGGTPSPGEPVPFTELIAFLPGAPSGWVGDDPSGATFQLQEWAWSQAGKDYTNQSTDELVSVLIYDSAYYLGFAWFQVWDMAFEIQSTDMYMKKITVDGYPAWETWYEPDEYSVMVFLADRFMVVVSAETKASLDQFSNLINYDGIAALD